MRSLLRVVAAVARNRPLAAVMVAYGAFSATQNAAWIAMLVYAYARGGAGTAGAVAIAQLLPAALLAPVAAAMADRRSPVGVLVGGYLVQVAGMLATAVAIGLEVPPAAYVGGRGRLRCGGHDQTGTDRPGPRVGAPRRGAHGCQR